VQVQIHTAPQPVYDATMYQRKKGSSYFEKFFVLQDGIISLSLRDLTLIGCILITASLGYMLYDNCENQYVECSWEKGIPMISGIICLPIYDRVACLLFTPEFIIHPNR
jgi:hypothetical protein